MPGLRPLSVGSVLRIFGFFSLLLLVVTRLLIPRLAVWSGQETILMWFTAAGIGVFTPLLITALWMIRKEGLGLNSRTWQDRLRFRALSRHDLGWSLGGLLLIGLLTALLMKGLEFCLGTFNHTPSFMSFEPLSTGRYWLLAVWFPFWLLNILGEEILWRGVLLPRQEIASGRSAWFIHGLGWGLFHLAFGWQLGLSLIPILFILPWVVQKTGNSWTGVIIHAGLNGPGFLAIALGMI